MKFITNFLKVTAFIWVILLFGCTQSIVTLDKQEMERKGQSYCAYTAVSKVDSKILCTPGDCVCHDNLTHEAFWMHHEALKGKTFPQ